MGVALRAGEFVSTGSAEACWIGTAPLGPPCWGGRVGGSDPFMAFFRAEASRSAIPPVTVRRDNEGQVSSHSYKTRAVRVPKNEAVQAGGVAMRPGIREGGARAPASLA